MKKNSITTENYHVETVLATSMGARSEENANLGSPLFLGTSYLRDEQYEKKENRGYIRGDNASLDHATSLITSLEHGHDGLLFSSGSAAMCSVFYALKSGDIAVVQDSLYFGLPKFLKNIIMSYNITIIWAKTDSESDILDTIEKNKPQLVWLETPSNPFMYVLDIAKIAQKCHACGGILAVDNTISSPLIQQPLCLGADIVMHSATKILNGHHDVLAGVLVCKENSDFWLRIKDLWFLSGWQISSFDAYLLLRGLKTLALRVERQSHNAFHIAHFLEKHPQIAKVNYPGLPSCPYHEIAKKQMKNGFGFLMSFHVKDGEARCVNILTKLKFIARATSLGSTESLAEYRYIVEGEDRVSPPDLIRFSVGIENIEDIKNDWMLALS